MSAGWLDLENDQISRWLGSPPPPPNTQGEHVVSWWRRHPHQNEEPVVRRRVFHSAAKARAFRTHLEEPEREDGQRSGIVVLIHYRPTGAWREVA